MQDYSAPASMGETMLLAKCKNEEIKQQIITTEKGVHKIITCMIIVSLQKEESMHEIVRR
jgi:hypothetical protein